MNGIRRISSVALVIALVFSIAPAAFADGSRDRVVQALLDQVPSALKGAPAEPTTVSVYGIECADEAFDSPSFQDRLITALLDSGRYKVIDRKSLAVLLKEQELAFSGLVDDTGEMVQAGKLIGVKGFFFGTLEFGAEGATLSLKLVDTETGAIVLSRKITASDPAFIHLGGGVAYTFVSLDLGDDGSVDQTNHGVGFQASWRQGFDAWTWGYAAADILFYRGFSPQAPENTLSVSAIKPSLHFILPRPLGFTVSPYVGAAAEMLLLGPTPTQPDGLAFYPLAGIDLNLTKSLSVFAEGGWRPTSTLVKAGTQVYIPSGPVASAGLKFFLNLKKR